MADRPVNNHKGIAKFLTYKGRISRKQFMIYHLYAFVVCITLLNLFLLAFPAWKLEALKGAVGLFCLISLFFWARRSGLGCPFHPRAGRSQSGGICIG